MAKTDYFKFLLQGRKRRDLPTQDTNLVTVTTIYFQISSSPFIYSLIDIMKGIDAKHGNIQLHFIYFLMFKYVLPNDELLLKDDVAVRTSILSNYSEYSSSKPRDSLKLSIMKLSNQDLQK